MRIRIARLITIFVIILNLLSLYFILKFVVNLNLEESSIVRWRGLTATTLPQKLTDQQFIEKSITVVISSFELFENDVPETIASFLLLYPNIQILIINDVVPYPPLHLEGILNSTNNVKVCSLQVDLSQPFDETSPLLFVKTRYVLFVPDSTRITSKLLLRSMISRLTQQQTIHLLTAPVSSTNSIQCLKVQLEVREWYIQYETLDGDICDAILGKHVILVETSRLKKLPEAFMLPFPNALYLQTTAQNLKVQLIRDVSLEEGKILFQTEHERWKLEELNKAREEAMLRRFRLKKVIRETGGVTLHGCTRSTPRCFGSVVGDMPQYLLEGRWTPPCCLAWLRQTARHVFKHLENFGVRYWLEGGSLLGAMRSSDILPWDYDVDVGIYQEDITKCPWLAGAQNHPVVDNDGYVWEKATEGDFFRVQFSASNHLHVDLFPFYSRNGTMTKNTWFASHKQDCEFPEHFLHPMASIEFVGQSVSAPNNIRDFLELKFGKGAIENPEYPDPQKLKFSPNDIPENLNVET